MLTIWRFMDGNRAHEKQSAALVSGLRAVQGADQVVCCDVSCAEAHVPLWGQPSQALRDLPAPDFILGAGHRSHWPVLRARRLFGGRSVVVMKPTLPLAWFDFVIAPEHDQPRPLQNVILTRGALAEPLPDFPAEFNRALLLLGGPSKHFHWDAAKIAAVTGRLLKQPRQWIVSDSRRTPQDTLAQCADSGAELHPWQQCSADWLGEQMARAGQIWVTGDSVSMIHEALQSRVPVGVIPMPSRSPCNKIRMAVDRLLDEGLVTDRIDGDLHTAAPRQPLAQQVMCAQALLRRSGWREAQPVMQGSAL
ncbi:ELM1/GtrOC1 family putative glycosyltransferase [uncultured Microbulbifer sp.]|uniref:mitochondrial fission ELM1 family protein n=1 Tax=uncultured Microbulbifer sp. TaxID=348147 RepID=UPI002626DCE5|nr:ELM1/GtrOC1 family putative glycosyltransferase [uncultured Microbulbifer sp.]